MHRCVWQVECGRLYKALDLDQKQGTLITLWLTCFQFMGILTFLALLLLIGAILAIVFHEEVGILYIIEQKWNCYIYLMHFVSLVAQTGFPHKSLIDTSSVCYLSVVHNNAVLLFCSWEMKSKDSMEDTLVNYYGVDFHKTFNRGVTWGWDKTQERVLYA